MQKAKLRAAELTHGSDMPPHGMPPPPTAETVVLRHVAEMRGCMLGFPFCCCVKKRAYKWVMENRIETNNPCCIPCLCFVKDCISVTYFDSSPFAPTCCGKMKPRLWRAEEVCGVGVCIPAGGMCYNLCLKPCFGAAVFSTSHDCGGNACLAGTFCCPVPAYCCLKDNKVFIDATTLALEEHRLFKNEYNQLMKLKSVMQQKMDRK